VNIVSSASRKLKAFFARCSYRTQSIIVHFEPIMEHSKYQIEAAKQTWSSKDTEPEDEVAQGFTPSQPP
jgi:hypothetical protein